MNLNGMENTNFNGVAAPPRPKSEINPVLNAENRRNQPIAPMARNKYAPGSKLAPDHGLNSQNHNEDNQLNKESNSSYDSLFGDISLHKDDNTNSNNILSNNIPTTTQQSSISNIPQQINLPRTQFRSQSNNSVLERPVQQTPNQKPNLNPSMYANSQWQNNTQNYRDIENIDQLKSKRALEYGSIQNSYENENIIEPQFSPIRSTQNMRIQNPISSESINNSLGGSSNMFQTSSITNRNIVNNDQNSTFAQSVLNELDNMSLYNQNQTGDSNIDQSSFFQNNDEEQQPVTNQTNQTTSQSLQASHSESPIKQITERRRSSLSHSNSTRSTPLNTTSLSKDSFIQPQATPLNTSQRLSSNVSSLSKDSLFQSNQSKASISLSAQNPPTATLSSSIRNSINQNRTQNTSFINPINSNHIQEQSSNPNTIAHNSLSQNDMNEGSEKEFDMNEESEEEFDMNEESENETDIDDELDYEVISDLSQTNEDQQPNTNISMNRSMNTSLADSIMNSYHDNSTVSRPSSTQKRISTNISIHTTENSNSPNKQNTSILSRIMNRTKSLFGFQQENSSSNNVQSKNEIINDNSESLDTKTNMIHTPNHYSTRLQYVHHHIVLYYKDSINFDSQQYTQTINDFLMNQVHSYTLLFHINHTYNPLYSDKYYSIVFEFIWKKELNDPSTTSSQINKQNETISWNKLYSELIQKLSLHTYVNAYIYILSNDSNSLTPL